MDPADWYANVLKGVVGQCSSMLLCCGMEYFIDVNGMNSYIVGAVESTSSSNNGTFPYNLFKF